MTFLPTSKSARRVFIVSMLVSLFLCLWGFKLNGDDFGLNLLAELVGLALSTAVAVSILDWYETRRRKDEAKHVIHIIARDICHNLADFIKKASPEVFAAAGYDPGKDEWSSVEFFVRLMDDQSAWDSPQAFDPLLAKHINNALHLLVGKPCPFQNGRITPKKAEPANTVSSALLLVDHAEALVRQIHDVQLPRLGGGVHAPELTTWFVAVERTGNDFIEAVRKRSDAAPPSESDQKVIAASLAGFVLGLIGLHNFLVQRIEPIRH